MKLGPILLLNVLIAGGAVFTYHMVAAPSPSTPSSGYPEVMTVDTGPVEDAGTEAYVPEPALQGVGDEVYRKKVEKLEKELASMKALLAGMTAKGGTTDGSGSERGAMPAIELPVVEEGVEEPAFEDDTLRSFRALLEQVEQQRRDERIKDGLKRQLDRLGVELSEQQEQAVIQATVGFRDKTRDMWRNLPRGADDQAREKRREAMETMREEYSKTVYSLVPAADAEKIVNSMGRGMGFSTRMGGRDGGRRDR